MARTKKKVWPEYAPPVATADGVTISVIELNAIMTFSSKDETRTMFFGVGVELRGDDAWIGCSDGHTAARIPLQGRALAKAAFWPTPYVTRLLAIARAEKQTFITLAGSDREQTIDAPPISKVIPGESTIDVHTTLDARYVARAGAFAAIYGKWWALPVLQCVGAAGPWAPVLFRVRAITQGESDHEHLADVVVMPCRV